MRGLAVMRELTPRATDAISAYGERISSLIVAAHLRRCGMNYRACRLPQRHRHRPSSHPGRAALRGNQPAASGNARADAGRWSVRGDGRLHRIHGRRRHHHARPRRIGLHGGHCRRGHRRGGNPDLDRRRRHAHGRSHRYSRRASRESMLVHRSRRAGVFRRESAASRDGSAGHREEYSGADSQLAPARSGRHAHRLRSAAVLDVRSGPSPASAISRC